MVAVVVVAATVAASSVVVVVFVAASMSVSTSLCGAPKFSTQNFRACLQQLDVR